MDLGRKPHGERDDGRDRVAVLDRAASKLRNGGAPDGEEYMATALILPTTAGVTRPGSSTTRPRPSGCLDLTRTKYFNCDYHIVKFVSGANYTDELVRFAGVLPGVGLLRHGQRSVLERSGDGAHARSSRPRQTRTVSFPTIPRSPVKRKAAPVPTPSAAS